ncbi:MAG TPA: hypothetical protein VMR86_00695, partial [Myxococcota bacterium]|nr:hypothetical protein [Myxococcota bacterium]
GGIAPAFAQSLSDQLGIEVRASEPLSAGDLSPFPGTQQYAAEDVIARARVVGERFPNRRPRSIVIALTEFDINTRARATRFVFAQTDGAAHAAVLSLARLVYDAKTGQKATPALVDTRVDKMLRRIIGEQLFGYAHTSDIHDVMYSPINSLDDLDTMGSEYLSRTPGSAGGSRKLPPPPAGYTWREINELHAAVLVPTGWFFKSERGEGVFAAFVTKEEIGTSGYETGVSINAYVGNSTAPGKLGMMLREMAAKNSAKVTSGQQGVFATETCEFDSPREGGVEPVHMFVVGIVNTRTSASYLITLESPASHWDAASKQVQPVLEKLALDPRL